MAYVWEALSAVGTSTANTTDADYYNSPRSDLLGRITQSPRTVLDIGCGGGATGAELKRRYPAASVYGVELSAEPAALAATRLDRVFVENVEHLDFASLGFAQQSIDLVLFPDILEHLYDPWTLVRKMRPFLTRNARVLASIPNVRNLRLIEHLLSGNWQYESWGLLDVTHIRFFTRKTIFEMFENAGYRILSLAANCDASGVSGDVAPGKAVEISTDKLVVRNVTSEDLVDFRTIQFLVEAAPL